MRQVAQTLTRADGHVYGVLICDRDAKCSATVRDPLQEGGLRVIQTPYRAECERPLLTLRALN